MKSRVAVAMAAGLLCLVIVLITRYALAEASAKLPKEVAYAHIIRLMVVEVKPLESVDKTQIVELQVERFYGKIEQRSFDRAQKHETQRFTILFPASLDTEVKPGDIIDYQITGYLSRNNK